MSPHNKLCGELQNETMKKYVDHFGLPFLFHRKGSDIMEPWKVKYRKSLFVLLWIHIFVIGVLLFALCSKKTVERFPVFSEKEVVSTSATESFKGEKVIPGGSPVGIYIETEGALVLGTQSVEGMDGNTYEPAKYIIEAGDYITKANGVEVHSKEELTKIVKEQGNSPMILELMRKNKNLSVKIEPVLSKENGEYQLGIWVRDNSQGIGTLTYIKGDQFGALGHGIHDIDTGSMMDVKGGYIFESKILSIKKGAKGKPGEMVGTVCYDFDNPYGMITKNTNYGIFGNVTKKLTNQVKQEEVGVGVKEEVKKGKAYIRSSISGKMEDYEIKITDVDASNKNLEKGMIIEITDPRLLELTNGIVQGMSGTPILQNGKLIGAVTHVFVQDSTKGYGTFIENMLKQSNK